MTILSARLWCVYADLVPGSERMES